MDSTREAVAERLRIARENAGLSQGQAAKKLGMHRPTISEIEAGRRSVKVEELEQFAAVYQVGTPWLLGEDADTSEPEQERIRVAARELARMKPQDITKVLEFLRSVQGGGRSAK